MNLEDLAKLVSRPDHRAPALARHFSPAEITNYARTCDEILQREPGTTLAHLLAWADQHQGKRHLRQLLDHFYCVLWLPDQYDEYMGRVHWGFPHLRGRYNYQESLLYPGEPFLAWRKRELLYLEIPL